MKIEGYVGRQETELYLFGLMFITLIDPILDISMHSVCYYIYQNSVSTLTFRKYVCNSIDQRKCLVCSEMMLKQIL